MIHPNSFPVRFTERISPVIADGVEGQVQVGEKSKTDIPKGHPSPILAFWPYSLCLSCGWICRIACEAALASLGDPSRTSFSNAGMASLASGPIASKA